MGSGGGSSGSINYPTYLKDGHYNWLRGWSAGVYDEMTFSVVDLMNTAQTGNSPYNGETAIDPDGAFFNTGDTLSTYAGQNPYKLLALFLAETPESLYTTYATDAAATAMIAAFSTDLATEYDSRIIPLLNVGYSDLNASMSSAYTIGLANVAAQQTREVAKFTADIKTRIALQRVQTKIEWRRQLSVLSVEQARIYLAAKHEEQESNLDYSSRDVLWDLETYQYGSNVMAAISGATASTAKPAKPSALGAGLSGAAAGAMIGSQITTGAGGTDAGTATLAGAIIGATVGVASTM